jgi:hypothetical protein
VLFHCTSEPVTKVRPKCVAVGVMKWKQSDSIVLQAVNRNASCKRSAVSRGSRDLAICRLLVKVFYPTRRDLIEETTDVD